MVLNIESGISLIFFAVVFVGYQTARFNAEQESMEIQIPEIQRTNLGNVVLLLKSLGVCPGHFLRIPVLVARCVCSPEYTQAFSSLEDSVSLHSALGALQ